MATGMSDLDQDSGTGPKGRCQTREAVRMPGAFEGTPSRVRGTCHPRFLLKLVPSGYV